MLFVGLVAAGRLITVCELNIYISPTNREPYVDMSSVLEVLCSTPEQLKVHRRKMRDAMTKEDAAGWYQHYLQNDPSLLCMTVRSLDGASTISIQHVCVLDTMFHDRMSSYVTAAKRLILETPAGAATVEAFIAAVHPFQRQRNPISIARVLQVIHFMHSWEDGLLVTTVEEAHEIIQLFLRDAKQEYEPVRVRRRETSRLLLRLRLRRHRQRVGGYASFRHVVAARTRYRRRPFLERLQEATSRARARSRAYMTAHRRRQIAQNSNRQ